MKYIFQTSDLSTISLQDMVINRVFENNGDIVLEFKEGFVVTKDNETNNTGLHMQTKKSVLILTKGSFISAKDLHLKQSISKDSIFNGNI